MRATFSKKVTDPRVSTYEGTFDHTGVPDGWADLVVAAQVSCAKGKIITWLTVYHLFVRLGFPLVSRL